MKTVMFKSAPPQVRAPVGLLRQLKQLQSLNGNDRAVYSAALHALSAQVAMVRSVEKAQPERIQEFLGREARYATIDALSAFVRMDLLTPLHRRVFS